jgi:hypothetical protein
MVARKRRDWLLLSRGDRELNTVERKVVEDRAMRRMTAVFGARNILIAMSTCGESSDLIAITGSAPLSWKSRGR